MRWEQRITAGRLNCNGGGIAGFGGRSDIARLTHRRRGTTPFEPASGPAEAGRPG